VRPRWGLWSVGGGLLPLRPLCHLERRHASTASDRRPRPNPHACPSRSSAPPASVGGVLPGGLQLRGLSGGERRRVSVAIGCLAYPSILFLDGARQRRQRASPLFAAALAPCGAHPCLPAPPPAPNCLAQSRRAAWTRAPRSPWSSTCGTAPRTRGSPSWPAYTRWAARVARSVKVGPEGRRALDWWSPDSPVL
jgi:hypothetical protein